MRPNAELRQRMRGQGFVTVREAARRTGLSRSTIYHAIQDGQIEKVDLAKRQFVKVQSLLAFAGAGGEVLWNTSSPIEDEDTDAGE